MRTYLMFFAVLYFSLSISANETEVTQLIDSTKHYWRMDFKKAHQFASKAILNCDTSEYELYGECLKNIGVVYYFRSKPDSAVLYYEEALTLFKKAESNVGISKVLNNLGIIKMEQGKYEDALSYYDQSYQLSLSKKDTGLIINTMNNIANIFYAMHNYTKCIEKSNEMNKYFTPSTNVYIKASNYQTKYSCYLALNELPEYEIFTKKALMLYKSIGDSIGIATTYTNMANGYEKYNHFSKAIQLNEKALKIFSN